MLENCLFGAVSLTKNPDIDQYKYSGYGIGFDRHGEFSFGNGYGKNCVIFGADLSSSSMHANYKKKKKKKNILVLGKNVTQGVNGATIYGEGLYKINFTENTKKFYLTLKFINSPQRTPVANPLCLGNISTDFSVDKQD